MDFEKLAVAMGELDEDTVKEILENVGSPADANAAMEACQKGMDTVGKLFEEGEYFVGDLIYAGELMTDAVEVLKPYLAGTESAGSKTRHGQFRQRRGRQVRDHLPPHCRNALGGGGSDLRPGWYSS